MGYRQSPVSELRDVSKNPSPLDTSPPHSILGDSLTAPLKSHEHNAARA